MKKKISSNKDNNIDNNSKRHIFSYENRNVIYNIQDINKDYYY